MICDSVDTRLPRCFVQVRPARGGSARSCHRGDKRWRWRATGLRFLGMGLNSGGLCPAALASDVLSRGHPREVVLIPGDH